MNHISVSEALNMLGHIDSPFLKLFAHGSLEVEIYKPIKVDLQTPHSRDEVYVIAEGNAEFIHSDQSRKVAKGDFLFVPAGDEHRFVDFSEDFCTWVLFYGPEGGERD